MYNIFFMDEGLLSIFSAGFGQLVKMLITLEQHGIIGSNFNGLIFYKIQEMLQSNINFNMGRRYKQESKSRDITQSGKNAQTM